jgi:peptide/nickel transport system ATP-binding protein
VTLTATPRAAGVESPDGADDAVLSLRELTTEFRTPNGYLRAVDRVSIDLRRARVLAIIGESGSGKSALLRSILGLHPASARVSGAVLLEGRDLLKLSKRQREAIRGDRIAMVFQDPLTALDPVFTVEKQLTETIRRHLGMGKSGARERALELLQQVQIPSPEHRLGSYPFELSGGMRQRVVIAMALACEPEVLLADEPTTALDVTVQARVMSIIREIQRERQMSMILVTHDLAAASQIADDLAVMYGGRLVESGPASSVLKNPAHRYTKGLLGANVQAGQSQPPDVIPGAPPNLLRLPPGCAFAPRCGHDTMECWSGGVPPIHQVGESHWAACHHTLQEEAALQLHGHQMAGVKQ